MTHRDVLCLAGSPSGNKTCCANCVTWRERSRKKKSEAETITATFRGQIRASENTRDSPETVIDVGGGSGGGGGCHLQNEFRNQDGFRCETVCTGERRVLPTLLCEWPGVDKSGSWKPTLQCGLKCNTARMRNYVGNLFFFSQHRRIKWEIREWKGSRTNV